MVHGDALGLFVGAVALGAVHGIEPGHGWPVAASYALDQANAWVFGIAASVILGIGHLVSSIAMVAVFFYAKSFFNLTQVNDPIQLSGPIVIGGPVSLVAGVLLTLLGIREYRHGHAHNHGHTHTHGDAHDHGPHGHDHAHSDGVQFTGVDENQPVHEHGTHGADNNGLWRRLKRAVPFVGDQSHDHGTLGEAPDRGLWGIAWFAFLLGFAHEEEFEIIALCAGSTYCLELMAAYALTVIAGIVGLTMLLIAGYEHFEERVKRYTHYLPIVSSAVLVGMGIGFILGVL
ncbi:hypothetical protein [Halosegnis sp.]|uniref:hypothetical protein n=1 Tax=Halosegnis sp. TaxID=2864959 RepID=UPI0035D40EA5